MLRFYIRSESTAEVLIGFLEVFCIIFSPVLSAVYVPVCLFWPFFFKHKLNLSCTIRSVKVHIIENKLPPCFQVLDFANIDNVSPVRVFTHVSIQSIHGLILGM